MQVEETIQPNNEHTYQIPIDVEISASQVNDSDLSGLPSTLADQVREHVEVSDQSETENDLVEYDATGKQSIPSLLPTEDGLAPVTLIFEPCANGKPFDFHLKAYVRKMTTTRETDTDGEAFLAREEAQLAAACELFDTVVTDIQGLGDEGEEKPDNWRELIGAQEKRNAVDTAILFARTLEDKKTGARASWKSLGGSVTRLTCLVNGREVELRHTLKKADPKIVNEFLGMLERAANKETAKYDTLMFELGGLYDRLKIGARPYKNDVVPTHHKASVLVAHINRQLTAIRKN